MIITPFRPEHGRESAQLFRETILHINRADYGEEACLAWAAGAADTDRWVASFQGHPALAAVEKGRLIGFGDIWETGYLDRLFVHARCQGGIGSALLCSLEAAVSVPILRTEASLTARLFFEVQGWHVVRRQEVVRRGVALVNFVMEKKRGSQ